MAGLTNLNKVLLIGNLTRDPDLKYTPSGAAVAKFGLAVNRSYKQNDEWQKEVCFLDVTVWGRQAETVSEYLKKGRMVFVEGRLQFSQWEAKDGGGKRSKIEVIGERVQFLSSAKDDKTSSSDDINVDEDAPEGGFGDDSETPF